MFPCLFPMSYFGGIISSLYSPLVLILNRGVGLLWDFNSSLFVKHLELSGKVLTSHFLLLFQWIFTFLNMHIEFLKFFYYTGCLFKKSENMDKQNLKKKLLVMSLFLDNSKQFAIYNFVSFSVHTWISIMFLKNEIVPSILFRITWFCPLNILGTSFAGNMYTHIFNGYVVFYYTLHVSYFYQYFIDGRLVSHFLLLFTVLQWPFLQLNLSTYLDFLKNKYLEMELLA